MAVARAPKATPAVAFVVAAFVHAAIVGLCVPDMGTAYPLLSPPAFVDNLDLQNQSPFQEFGYAMAADGNHMAVIASGAAGPLVFLFRRLANGAMAEVNSTTPPGVALPVAYAAVAMSDGVLLVSVPFFDDPGGESQSGAVFVYTYGAGSDQLPLVEVVYNPQPRNGGGFGRGIATGGGAAVVGAPGNGNTTAGEAFVYAVNGTLAPVGVGSCALLPWASPVNEFGHALDIDAGLAAVSASDFVTSSVHVYRLGEPGGDVCPLSPTPLVSVAASEVDFIESVSLSNDLLVAGSPSENGVGAVAVWRLDLNATGGSATLLAEIPFPLTSYYDPEPQFGYAVAAGNNGATFVVGSPATPDAGGTIFVFSVEAVGGGQVSEAGILNSPDENARFGAAIVVHDGELFVGAPDTTSGIGPSHGRVGRYALAPSETPLLVDAAFCASYSLNLTGECIGTAVSIVNAFPGRYGALLLGGNFTGCATDGLEIERDYFVVASASYPFLPNEPEVWWSCEDVPDARHLRISGRQNFTLAGIGFTKSSYSRGNGGAVVIRQSTNVVVDACHFADVSAVGADSQGGAVSITNSDVVVTNTVARNTSAVASGGFLHVDGTGDFVVTTAAVHNATAEQGGAIWMESGDLSQANFYGCAANMGGSVFVGNNEGSVAMESVFVVDSVADVSGGGIFIEAGNHAATIDLRDVTVEASTAGAVGGGIAVRAVGLNSGPTARSLALTGVRVERCSATRGGGLFSEINTAVVDCEFLENNAIDRGGGVALQPSPCLAATVTVTGSTFQGNEALVGGGMYALSVAVDVTTSVFAENSADESGGGLAVDCEAEVCVAKLPRDTCGNITSFLSSTEVRFNAAQADGGGVYVANHALEVTTVGMDLSHNTAKRGAGVFTTPSATMTVDGSVGREANGALLGVAESDSNVATAFGPIAASPAALPSWEKRPGGSEDIVFAMAGTNLCADGTGCVATMEDAYGNVATTATVLEVLVSNGAPAVVDGPQYVLVADGFSAPIPDLAIHIEGDYWSAANGAVVAVDVSLHFIDDRVTENRNTPGAVVTVTACDAGFGGVIDPVSQTAWCEPCSAGFASPASGAISSCLACDTGTTTAGVAAPACDWCAAGYGWDESAAACLACPVGAFSDNATDRAPCRPCVSGLTTSGSGANLCAVVVGGVTTGLTGVLIVVTAATALVGLVALIVSCLRNRSARHGAIGTVLLSLYDVITDYLFLISLIDRSNEEGSPDLSTLVVVCAGSVGAAFLINALLTAFILLRERRRPLFAKWMRQNVVVVAVTAVLGTTNVSVLGVLNSRIFDVDATNAPITRDTGDLIDFGGVASVLFEDAPQLVVAIAYLGIDPDSRDSIVYLTILASAASVLTGLFLRLILCCVVGVDDDSEADGTDVEQPGPEAGDGLELGSLNPTFDS